MILPIFTLALPAQKTFYLLCLPEALKWRKIGLHQTGPIQESIVAQESPGLCFDETGGTQYRANALVDEFNGSVQQFLAVADELADLIDEEHRRKDLFPVGRLDRDTEGLLLITNDEGQLAIARVTNGEFTLLPTDVHIPRSTQG